MYYVYVTCYVLTNHYMLCQAQSSAPGLDIMLLKQQFLSVSGQAANQARQHPPAPTTVATRTFRLPWCSSAPLRNFA